MKIIYDNEKNPIDFFSLHNMMRVKSLYFDGSRYNKMPFLLLIF